MMQYQNHRVIIKTEPTNGSATITFRDEREAHRFAEKHKGMYQAQNMRGEWKLMKDYRATLTHATA